MPSTVFVHLYSGHSHLIPKMSNLNFIIFNIFIYFYCGNDLDGNMHILSNICVWPWWGCKRGYQISWNLSYSWLPCRLGIKPGSSAIEASTLNHLSSSLKWIFQIERKIKQNIKGRNLNCKMVFCGTWKEQEGNNVFMTIFINARKHL